MDQRAQSSSAGAGPGGPAPAGVPSPAPTAQDGTRPILALTQITKRFGELVAVDGVDLEFHRGEVHAVLGENGAGKTTLMNIVAGFLLPDEGTMTLQGVPVRFSAPRDALASGIGMVHQHFRLVERFTVAENLALGDRDVPFVIDRRDLDSRVREWSQRFGLAIDPDAEVWRLSAGEQQRVEVLRALARGAELLILDEPTSVLTPQESEHLCEILRGMAAQGKAIVFISHKLNEVLAVADRVTVMRQGSRLTTLPRSECRPDDLAKLMVGKAAKAVQREEREAPGERPTVLELRDVTVHDHRGLEALRGLDLTLRAGEVLGIAGVAGNGQVELADVVAGVQSPDAGAVIVADEDLAGSGPRAFIRRGVAYVPDDRQGTGLVPSQPIWRNAIMKRYREAPISRGVLIRTGRAKQFAQLAGAVGLSTTDVDTPVEHLSGGNAQKLLTGRELGTGESAVVAVNPTQGLDVGAAADVWRALLEARDRSAAVLLVSHDLDELMRLSDRISVLYEGEIVGEFAARDADRGQIGLLMAGITDTTGSAEDG